MKPRSVPILLLFALALTMAVAEEPQAKADAPSKEALPEFTPPAAPSPDMATICAARRSAIRNPVGKVYLYLDDALLGVTPNGSWWCAHVPEGRHTLWVAAPFSTSEARDILTHDFVGGNTYCVVPMSGFGLVPKTAFEVELAKGAKPYTIGGEDREKAEKLRSRVRSRLDEILAKEVDSKRRTHFPVEVTPLPPAPESPGEKGFVLVPKRTRLLIQNEVEISSETMRAGDRIRFTVAENVQVGEKTVFAKGHALEGVVSLLNPRQGGGRAAALNVALQDLTDAAGRNIPLWSSVAMSGKNCVSDASVAAFLVPVLSLAIRGDEVGVPVGGVFAAHVAADVWVKPDIP